MAGRGDRRAPVLLASLFGIDTVMCIFLPMVTSRGVRDVPTALRAIRVSSVFFVLSRVITLVTHDTVGWVRIALVWLGHVTVTGAELSSTLDKVWAPALYTFPAMTWGAAGWLVIDAIVVAAAMLLHPAWPSVRRR